MHVSEFELTAHHRDLLNIIRGYKEKHAAHKLLPEGWFLTRTFHGVTDPTPKQINGVIVLLKELEAKACIFLKPEGIDTCP